MGIISKILGINGIVEKGMDFIDDIHYSDSEEAEDKRAMVKAKAENKIKLMEAYAPFKLAQRYIALMFVGVFIFILLNGVLGALYGSIDKENVEMAKNFANEMWLGEIVIAIITFYFGGGLASSIKNK